MQQVRGITREAAAGTDRSSAEWGSERRGRYSCASTIDDPGNHAKTQPYKSSSKALADSGSTVWVSSASLVTLLLLLLMVCRMDQMN